MNKDYRCSDKLEADISTSIAINKGFKQECCLFSTLYKICVQEAIQLWRRKYRGVGIDTGDGYLFTLYSADDQLLLVNDEEDVS